MANGNGEPTPQDQKKSGYTKVIMPDGSPKYFPSSLGEARIRQLASSQSGTPPTRGRVTSGSWAETTWEKAWKPTVGAEKIEKIMGGPGFEARHKETEKQVAAGHPVRAGLRAFQEGVAKDTTEFLSQFTSPGQIALMAATEGESTLAKLAPEARVLKTMLKIPGKAAMVAFGAKALATLGTPKQPGETDSDYLQRRLYAASAVFGTIGGGLSTVKDTAHALLRRQMGLNDDLAAKVSDQVSRIGQERTRGVAEKATIDTQAAERSARIDQATAQNVSQAKGITADKVSAITQSLDRDIASLQGETASRAVDINSEAERRISEAKGQVSDLQAQRIKETAQIVSDASLALDIEHGRVSAPFEDIGRKIRAPLTTTNGVREIIKESFKEHGAKESEIPSAAFKALGKGEGGDAYIDLGGSIKRLEVGEADPVSFNDLTRVRDDLWKAAGSSKDPQVRTALLDARGKVTAMQESAAKRANLGPEYRKAKDEYRDFKRGIGSDMAADFLNNEDAKAQAMVPKMKMLLNENTAEAMRTILASVGVDTIPLTEIIRDLKETGERAKAITPERKAQLSELKKSSGELQKNIFGQYEETISGIGKEGRESVSEIEKAGAEQSKVIEEQAKKTVEEAIKSAEERVKEIKGKESVVPGRDVEELAGKTRDQLTEERVRALMTKGQASGVSSMGAMTWAVFGLVRMVSGSPFGGFMTVRGLSSLEIPELARNRTFQDWLIRKSGVEPYSKRGASMRLGIARLYPMLRKLAGQGQTEAAAEEEAKRNRSPIVGLPPTREEAIAPR